MPEVEGDEDEVPDAVVPTLPEPRPPTVHRLSAWWLVILVFGVGIGWAATDHMLRATVTMSGACLGAAILRAFLPSDRAGGLVVRSRWLDVLILVVLALAIGTAGFALDLRSRV